jgi:hypothetical protein
MSRHLHGYNALISAYPTVPSATFLGRGPKPLQKMDGSNAVPRGQYLLTVILYRL